MTKLYSIILLALMVAGTTTDAKVQSTAPAATSTETNHPTFEMERHHEDNLVSGTTGESDSAQQLMMI